MQTSSLLKRLSEASGISGYEHRVTDIVREECQRFADSVSVDAIGNLIALKRGQRQSGAPERRIMICAHTDEIGLMVKTIDKGFLRFTTVGGFDPRTLVGQRVIVHGTQDLCGVIGLRPPHVVPPSERRKVVPLDDLFVDVGLSPGELSGMVKVGDVISLRREFIELQDGRAAGKALDDRAGVVAATHCLHELTGLKHEWDVYVVASAQEEVGLRGAMTSAFAVEPDIGVAIDVGFGRAPGLSEAETIELDKGPSIGLGPNFHPVMCEKLADVAKNREIPYQVEVIPARGGTDAWAIQVSQEGIPTALLSIPLRYMHTVVETACLKDIDRTGHLLASFISTLDESFAERIGLQGG